MPLQMTVDAGRCKPRMQGSIIRFNRNVAEEGLLCCHALLVILCSLLASLYQYLFGRVERRRMDCNGGSDAVRVLDDEEAMVPLGEEALHANRS